MYRLSHLFLPFSLLIIALEIQIVCCCFQVFVNGEVYDVGTVKLYEANNTTTIVGIILGIVAALVAGALLALVVMMYFRKKKQGEEIRGEKNNKKVANMSITSLFGSVCLLSYVS